MTAAHPSGVEIEMEKAELSAEEKPGDGIRRLRKQIQTVDRPKNMIARRRDQTSVSIDWKELRNSEGEATVPVAPFVLCKTVVEDEQGGLFLNGTIIQRLLVENIPDGKAPPQVESSDLAFLIKLKLLGYHPERRVLESRGVALHAKKAGLSQRNKLALTASETIDMLRAPLDLVRVRSWGPLSVLRATFDMALQPQVVDFSQPGEEEMEVTCFPDLCMSEKSENVVRVERPGSLSRLSRLAFLQEEPTIEFFQEKRLKMDAFEVEGADGLLVTHPRMRLTFWLTSDPVDMTARLTALCALLFVVILMVMNFEECFGIYAVLEGDDMEPRTASYRAYLANGIVLAVAAVLVTGMTELQQRGARCDKNRPTALDAMPPVFLLGLALSVWPVGGVALAGCLLSCCAVLASLVWLAIYQAARTHVLANARSRPLVVKEEICSGKALVKSDWKRVGE